MTLKGPCILTLLSLGGLWACRAKPEQATIKPATTNEGSCTPWAMQASERNIHVDVMGGHWQFDGSALLVGCKEELSALTGAERSAAVRGLSDFVQEQGLRVMSREDAAVRAAATVAINRAVGRAVVSDVWPRFSFAETGL